MYLFFGTQVTKRGISVTLPQTKKFYHSIYIKFFENQPYYPKNLTQGETIPPRSQQDLIDFKFLGLELGPLFHTTPLTTTNLNQHNYTQ